MLRTVFSLLSLSLTLITAKKLGGYGIAMDGLERIERSLDTTSNKIVWCEQPKHPKYNLTAGLTCEKMSTLVADPKSYDDFRRIFCVLRDHSQRIKFKHVRNVKYGKSKGGNLAYNTLKWGIINLKPDPSQLWLEFGVAGGFSINLTSYLKEEFLQDSSPTYGFDWFQGLPENWYLTKHQYFSMGTFSNGGRIPATRSSVKIIPGLFNQTLEPFLLKYASEKKISFVNIDMDLYSGAVYVLDNIIPFLSPGAILHFHDFYNHYNPCRSDEMEALYKVMFAKTNFSSLTLQMLPFHTVASQDSVVFRFV